MALWASCPANPHDEASKIIKNMRRWAFSPYLQILLALNGFCLLAMVIVGRLEMSGSAQFGYVLFLTFIAIFLLTAFFNYLLVPFTLLRAILNGIVLAFSCKGRDFCPSCINSNTLALVRSRISAQVGRENQGEDQSSQLHRRSSAQPVFQPVPAKA